MFSILKDTLLLPLKLFLPALVACVFTAGVAFGQPGKDGARTISSANTIVNEYTTLTLDAPVGATSLTLANAALNSAGIISPPIAPGDLILIIQMQGASIGTNDDTTYGNITSYNNCGNYELRQVATLVSGTVLTISCGLKKSYSANGKTQVVRVPRFASLTINSGGVLTCPAWNGSTGGIVAVEVQGATVINSGGSINATGRGFRGGVVADNLAGYGVLNYRWNTGEYGAEKGESIAGSTADYDAINGRYAKGAPANGGGGANAHNGGGGGGGNAGNPANWTGRGNPDISNATWTSAWNLEYSGFASSTSSGGGKGGYTFSSSNQNALSLGPFNSAWGGDQRRESGGRGGRALDYSTGRIFLGGGGGAGDQNDGTAGAGGVGGGIVFIYSLGTISGSGSIVSNGQNGSNTSTSNGNDGAGGGGAGGTVILQSAGTISGITVNANGGNGGTQTVSAFNFEAEGPGGGGGGGYIAISNGAITRTANGGPNGTTNSASLTEFPPNGATKGGAGQATETISMFTFTALGDSACPGGSATLTVTPNGTLPPGTVFQWFTAAAGGNPVFTGTSFTTPNLSASTTYYVGTCPGHYRIPVNVLVGFINVFFTAPSTCQGLPVTFTSNGTSSLGSIVRWYWNFGDGSPIDSSGPVVSHTYSSGGSYNVVLTGYDSFGCQAVSPTSITIQPAPQINFSAATTAGCAPQTIAFTNSTTGATTYSWNFGDGSAVSTATNPSHTYTSTGVYTVSLIASTGTCIDTLVRTNYINLSSGPTAAFTSTNNICVGDAIQFTNTSNGNGSPITGYTWNFGDGSPTSNQTSPSHTYASAGNFQVRLTAATAGCTDDTVITVNVSPGPVAAFTSSATSGCGPTSISFTNTTTGSPTYTWNFGDGTPTSSTASPTHTYSSNGTFTVTLIATQGSCADTVTSSNLITIRPKPTASFNASTNVCLGTPINFTNTSTGNGGTITSYSWNFGDGSPASTQTSPTYTYAASGTYQVRLTTNTANCTDDTVVTVNVSPGPVAAFTPSATNGCGPTSISFTNTTTGSPTYTWNFGDGSPTSSTASPTHTYSSNGTFTVTLIATQGSCADTVTSSNLITIRPKPTASFNAATNVCLGTPINFTNTSTGNGGTITSYSWNFGDGSPATTQTSPTYTYAASGTYQVRLTTNTANCTDDTVITVNVSPGPVAAFTPSATSGCGPTSISFTNTTTGSPTYTWNFGDGTPNSSTASPTHTYSSNGTFTVTLIATQGSCADTVTSSNLITIRPKPTASFNASTNVCLGTPINFTNTSTGNGGTITSYSWNFGDGSPASTQTSPTYTYTSSGTYQVRLTTNTANCTDDTVITVNVSPGPVAAFTPSATIGCGPTSISFTNTTTGSPTYTWNFGDGTPSSSTASPTHTYSNNGTFTVTLIATQGSCADTVTSSNLITIRPKPTASFTAVTSVCLGDAISFTNTSTGNGGTITSYSWNFGDGSPTSSQTSPSHTYAASGTYQVRLTTNTANCTDDTVVTVNVSPGPVAAFTPSATSGCGPTAITFTNTTTGSPTYTWNFGDGTPNSSTASPTHTYSSNGTFTVTLIATQGSCADTVTSSNLITIRPKPTASFTSVTAVCLGDAISFTNTSTGNGGTITSYSWNFGDGSPTSSQTSPSHTYAASGTYQVRLTTNTANCTDDTIITVNVSPGPVAAFTPSATSGCGPTSISFTNTTTGSPTYTWNFGDGTPNSSTASPTHTYSSNGTFTVTLIATQGSCADTVTSSNLITIRPKPTASFTSVTAVCLGDAISFTNTSTGNGGTITSYSWNFGDGSPTSSQTSPSHTYAASGTYQVRLTTNTANCTDDTVVTVNVSPGPVAAFTPSATSGCGPTSISFTNTTTGSPTYTWNFGDGTPSSSTASPTHTYSSNGTFTVTLIATQGSCADTVTSSNLITIRPQPTASFTSVTAVCLGDAISFTNTSTGNGGTITSYSWNFGDGSPTSSQTSPSHTYATSGNFQVRLTVGTASCTDDTVITVNVSPAPVAAFTPSATSGCGPTAITFTNTTTGSPTYTWNFGDGTPSSSTASPTHTYSSNGTFTVTLIATQGSCADTVESVNLITISPSPVAGFSMSNVCYGDTVYFTNNSVFPGSAVSSVSWNFGDGSPSSAVYSPAHLYASPSTYSVTLTVTNVAGCQSISSPQQVTVAPAPTVNFTYSNVAGCDSLTVNFTDQSTGAQTYDWQFGDGGISTAVNPTHQYGSPGNYTVTLHAVNAGGCAATKTILNLVTVRSSPVPGFSASATSICEDDCISFNGQSTGSPASWNWSFPGAQPSTSFGQNTGSICYFLAGEYDVTLTVSDGFCTGSTTQSQVIDVVDCTTQPSASFRSSDTSFCSGSCISFVSLSLNATSWLWSFPGATPSSSTLESPGNICYSAPGTYSVTLIASNLAGSDTMMVSNFIQVASTPPVPSFSISGDSLIAPVGYSYQWYFNGIPISGANNRIHIATLSGPYSVQVTDANSCSAVSPVQQVSLVGINDPEAHVLIEVYPNPVKDELRLLISCPVSRQLAVRFTDAIGRILLSETIRIPVGESTYRFSISGFSAGLYYLFAEDENHRWSRRIVKQ